MEVDHDEFARAVDEQDIEDDPVRARAHRLDPGAVRQRDRRSGKRGGGWSALRQPNGDGGDQRRGAADQQHAHDDDEDLQGAHRRGG